MEPQIVFAACVLETMLKDKRKRSRAAWESENKAPLRFDDPNARFFGSVATGAPKASSSTAAPLRAPLRPPPIRIPSNARARPLDPRAAFAVPAHVIVSVVPFAS